MDNPQDLINQALGSGTTTTPQTPDEQKPSEPVLPTLEPLTPSEVKETPSIPTASTTTDATIPTELTTNEASVPTATPTPTPVVAETVPTPVEAKADDVPLALVGGASADLNAATESPVAPVVVPVASEPTIPPAPSMTPPVDTKPKKKGLKVVGMIVGFFLLLGVVGVVAYTQYAKTGTIAYVNKFTRDSTGKVIINPNWDPNAVNPDTGKTAEEERNAALGIKQDTSSSGLPAEKAAPSNHDCGTSYSYCGGAIDKCVSFDALGAAGGGCNKYGEVNYGIASVYGANPGKGGCDPAKVSAGLQTECGPSECGGTETYCFDRGGSCNSTPITRLDGSVVDTGMCGLVGSKVGGVFKEYDGLFNSDGSLKYIYSCDINGCQTSDASCKIVKYACNGTTGSNSCTDNSSTYIKGSMSSGNNKTFSSKCGTVEQIDVACGGYITSRTKINPDCTEKTTSVTESPSPSPSTPVTPTLMCDGITRTPTTTPVIGDKLTFTCAGSTVPTGAVSLSYKFRYSINSGAYSAMINKTATTTEMTIASCGTYKVQCQTCGTINGVLTCDPNWTAATTQ